MRQLSKLLSCNRKGELCDKDFVQSIADSALGTAKSYASAVKKSLPAFIQEAVTATPEIQLHSLKPPLKRIIEVTSLAVKIPLRVKARATLPIAQKACELAFQAATGCTPLLISQHHPGTAEIFIASDQMSKATQALEAVTPTGWSILAKATSERDMTRRGHAYLRGYFLPLRLEALEGFNQTENSGQSREATRQPSRSPSYGKALKDEHLPRPANRHVGVSASEDIEVYTVSLNFAEHNVGQVQKQLSLLPEPDITSAAQLVQAQFHHSLNKLCEAYVADSSNLTLARIFLLPESGLSKKFGPRSAPKAIRYLRATQDISVASRHR